MNLNGSICRNPLLYIGQGKWTVTFPNEGIKNKIKERSYWLVKVRSHTAYQLNRPLATSDTSDCRLKKCDIKNKVPKKNFKPEKTFKK